jgi:[acyl-carrier-protein] S-malonyltransferase
MEKINFHDTHIPVVCNVNAKPTMRAQDIRENLAKQVTSSVLWVDSVRFMIESGVDTFIEFGPKKVLAGMIKKIDSKVKVLSIDKIDTLESVKEELKLLCND